MPLFLVDMATSTVNVVDKGADPTGATDSTTAITTARSIVNAAGGGIVFWPKGTFITGNQPCYNNVYDFGAGVGITTVKLKNGANTDLFSALTSSINLAAALQSSSNTAITNFGWSNMTLDGNKANQSSGTSYPIRVYGHRHILEHVEIKNGYSGGLLMDYNGNLNPSGGNNAFMPHWYDVMVHDCNGIGIQCGGPTDAQWVAVNAFNSAGLNLHLAPNTIACKMANCHFWAQGTGSVNVLNEAFGTKMANCQIEGSDTCALVLIGNDIHLSGCLIGTEGDAVRNKRGIQLGQSAGNTAIPGQVYQLGGLTTSQFSFENVIDARIVNCTTGALDEQNTGNNIYNVLAYQTSGTAITQNGGNLGSSATAILRVDGLTPDGTQGKGGAMQLGGQLSNAGFQVKGQDGTAFNINTMAKASNGAIQLRNGYNLIGYSDDGFTRTFSIDPQYGNMSLGNLLQLSNASAFTSGTGVPSSGFGNNGDYYYRQDTPGTANQRIYVKSAGAWIGIV